MRWKRVAWAGCLAPLFGGCLSVYHPHHDAVAEGIVAQSERGIALEIRKKASVAWIAVRCEFPRKVFTPEFRDGFLDGYTDYLDRGGDAQPPAVPPRRYTQNKKYFTPEGHLLVRDYFLGFKYGADVAVATGQRQYLTVPVLISEKNEYLLLVPSPGVPAIPPIAGSDAPVKPQPLPAPRPISKLPSPRRLPGEPSVPSVVSVPEVEFEGSKFGPVPSLPLPSKVGVPELAPPPLPVVPSIPEQGTSVPVLPVSSGKLPEPPREVPNLDPDLPTPPFVNDIPDLPPLPINHPDPVKK